MIQKENNQAQEFVRISELCFVYAKAKWMRTFKAFDLDGFFPCTMALNAADTIDDM